MFKRLNFHLRTPPVKRIGNSGWCLNSYAHSVDGVNFINEFVLVSVTKRLSC
jgi:hypothetical protein